MKIYLQQIKRAIWDQRREQISSQILNTGLTEAPYNLAKFEADMADSGLFSPDARQKKRWEYVKRNGLVEEKYGGKTVLPFSQFRDLMSRDVRERFEQLERSVTPSLGVCERESEREHIFAQGRARAHEEAGQ